MHRILHPCHMAVRDPDPNKWEHVAGAKYCEGLFDHFIDAEGCCALTLTLTLTRTLNFPAAP